MADFMPHGHCYLWKPGLVWLEVITNGLIGMSYVAISATLAYLIKKGDYLPFRGMGLAFGIFIIACGLTHFLDIFVIWDPIYWIDGGVRAVTAVASVGTALLLPALVPKAIALARGAKTMRERGIELEAAIADLGGLYEKTKELDELKTQFFANVSHELRTPLALIIGPAERMLEQRSLSAGDQRDTELILRNARLLLKHVNDLLDLSRLEAGKAAAIYSQVDVAQLVRQTAANFGALAAERRTKLVVEAPQELVADVDADKLRHIFVNLLSNAFKFTGNDSIVRCSLRSDGPEGVHFILEVADDGPGVRPEHRELVFERFRQADGGSSRRFGGTGLGLAIVKDFVDLHAGTVSIYDAPEGGALFRVVMPMRAPAGTEVRETEASAAGIDDETLHALAELRAVSEEPRPSPLGEKPTVLVVEDNPEMNRFICESLEPSFRAVQAFDGQSGFNLAISLGPDLIMTDVMMPRMNGAELLERLRHEGSMDAVPVMLLTAKADDELRVKLLEEGAQDFVMKPFSASELRARANNLITMKRTREILQRDLADRGADLQQLAVEVTQKNSELSTALDSMRVAREHAERATQLKSNFLSMVSHELRTPLASLLLQLERLQLGAPLPEDKQDLVRRMSVAAGRLHGLIEGLLSYAQIESGKLVTKVERLDLRALLDDVIAELAPHARKKGLELTLLAADVPAIQSDPALLRLIAINLIGNAIKFTDQGAVRVELTHGDGAHRLAVIDTGPGISPQLQPRIFEPFVQGEDVKNKHFAGVGLGLALVREMTSSVGGSILLDSEPGRGSRFTVVLPESTR